MRVEASVRDAAPNERPEVGHRAFIRLLRRVQQGELVAEMGNGG